MTEEVKLPQKLSACIRLALSDLRKVERSKRYVVEMDRVWHEPIHYFDKEDGEEKKKCAVCFAGSIIAKTMNSDIKLRIDPRSFSSHDANRLLALDALRSGVIDAAFKYIKSKVPRGAPNQIIITPYDWSPRKFKREMTELANLLEFCGA